MAQRHVRRWSPCVQTSSRTSRNDIDRLAWAQTQRLGRAWSALELGDDLFLVPVRRVVTMSALSFMRWAENYHVHSRGAVIRVCAFRTHCCSASLAPMAQAAPHWHG